MSGASHYRARQPEREVVASVLAPYPSSLGFGELAKDGVYHRATISHFSRRPYRVVVALAAIGLVVALMAVALCRAVNNKKAVPGVTRRRLAESNEGEDKADRRAQESELCEGAEEESALEDELLHQEAHLTQVLRPAPHAAALPKAEDAPRKRKHKTKKHDDDADEAGEERPKKAKMPDWLHTQDEDWDEDMQQLDEMWSGPLFGGELPSVSFDEEGSAASDAQTTGSSAFQAEQQLEPGGIVHSSAEASTVLPQYEKLAVMLRSLVEPSGSAGKQQADVDVRRSSAEGSSRASHIEEAPGKAGSLVSPDKFRGQQQAEGDDVGPPSAEESSGLTHIKELVAPLHSLREPGHPYGEPPLDLDHGKDQSSSEKLISPFHAEEPHASPSSLVIPDQATEEPQLPIIPIVHPAAEASNIPSHVRESAAFVRSLLL